MVDYRAIVDAIPQVEFDACMAELNKVYPLLRKVPVKVFEKIILQNSGLNDWWEANEPQWEGKEIIMFPGVDSKGNILIHKLSISLFEKMILNNSFLNSWWLVNSSLWVGKEIMKFPVFNEDGNEVSVNGKYMDLATAEAAFNAIKDLKTLVVPDLLHTTYKGIAQLSGFDVANQLQTNILSAIAAGDLAQWVDDAFNSDGINVKDSKFRAKIADLAGGHGFTPAFINQMKAIGDVESLDFPRLKLGHVQNALQDRHAGVI